MLQHGIIPDVRRQGVGRALVETAEETSRLVFFKKNLE